MTTANNLASLGNSPAFSAYQSTNQSFPSSSNTQVNLQTEDFDTASCFNNTASTVGGIPAYSFLPNVAGYYQVNGLLVVNATSCQITPYIYKNGSLVKIGSQATTGGASNVTALIYLNGSSDYIQFWGNITIAQQLAVGTYYTSFSAALVRAA